MFNALAVKYSPMSSSGVQMTGHSQPFARDSMVWFRYASVVRQFPETPLYSPERESADADGPERAWETTVDSVGAC